MKSVFFLACFLFLFAGCKKQNAWDCFKSTGQQKTEIRYPGEFRYVKIKDKLDVHFYKSPILKIELIGGEHVVGSVETSVNSGTLTLADGNHCNVVRGYKKVIRVNVYLPSLRYLATDCVGETFVDNGFAQDTLHADVLSSGDLHLDVQCTVIETNSTSNGDLYIKGNTRQFYAYANAVNFIQAEELQVTDYLNINTATTGDCHVNAQNTKVFEFRIQSKGNLYYKGTPGQLHDLSEGVADGNLIQD